MSIKDALTFGHCSYSRHVDDVLTHARTALNAIRKAKEEYSRIFVKV